MTEQGPRPIEPRIAVGNLSADLNKANTRRAGIATAAALTAVISLNGFANAQEVSPEPSPTPGTQELCPPGFHIEGTEVLPNIDLYSFSPDASLTPDASFNPEATPTATVEVSPIPSITPIESISPEASTSPDASIEVVDQTTGEIIICIPDEVVSEVTNSSELSTKQKVKKLETALKSDLPNVPLEKAGEKVIKQFEKDERAAALYESYYGSKIDDLVNLCYEGGLLARGTCTKALSAIGYVYLQTGDPIYLDLFKIFTPGALKQYSKTISDASVGNKNEKIKIFREYMIDQISELN